MKRMTIAEFHEAIRAQGVGHYDIALVCPACGTVQSAHDLIKAGAGKDFYAIAKYLGFSCVGRFTGAGAPSKERRGQGCNWTLGGLFQIHKLEVIDETGKACPRFELATPEQARDHADERIAAKVPASVGTEASHA